MIDVIFSVIVLVFSIIIHEVAHGAMAERLGDKTARDMGRITLNPIKHIDLFGSIIVPLLLVITHSNILIGWAKPVPINPYALRDRKYGEAKVAMAGPLINISVALFFVIFSKFIPIANSIKMGLIDAYLHGNQVATSALTHNSFFAQIFLVFIMIVWINLLLAFFNLVPIPPLDGSHILFAFLPKSAEGLMAFLNQFGIFFLIGFIYFIFPFFGNVLMQIFQLLVGTKII